MVNTSKILTVSYGTFSCTLEGFDDSFDTMKAIAEYFRDLAADDRYFGAEPPTPDADMLARIAEREIARRVEAHENEGKIVLRAGDAPALAALAAAQAPQHQPAKETPETPAEKAQAPGEGSEQSEPIAQQPTEDVAETSQPGPAADEVDMSDEAAPLAGEAEKAVQNEPETTDAGQAIDAPVEDIATGAASDALQLAEGEFEDDMENEPESKLEAAIEANAPAEPLPETQAQTAAAEDEQPKAEASQSVVEPFADTAEVAPEDDADSVAAKLRRIRSVVSHSDQDYGHSDYTEDEHAEDEYSQDFVDDTAADLDDALAQDNDSDIAAAAQDDAVQAQYDGDDLDALLARFDDEQQDGANAETADFTGSESEGENVELAEDTLAQLLADAMPKQDQAHDGPQTANDDFGAPLRLGPESAIDTASDDSIAEADDSSEDQTDAFCGAAPVGPPPLRARVVKMKRSEFEAALAEGYIEEEDDDNETRNVFNEADDDEGDDPEIQDSGLSPEEEAELQRELAEVEAELKMDAAPKEDAVQQSPEPADAADLQSDGSDATETRAENAGQIIDEMNDTALRGREKLDRVQKPQADVNRIFDKADTHLDEPESNQRRSVIRHLRAAVAATRAEQSAGAKLDKNVDDTPYRSDLQEVVRPRRPQSSGPARLARPEDQRPAPLKLVAEQRVDTDARRDPVRPRRISSSALVPAQSLDIEADSGFADFAQQMGATRLPDLLEAAAAYLSDVEGRPQFSRPMLMGKLKEVSRDNFSREDGLRSFGQLLRDGKLQKLKGGRFTVTEETDFRDRARNAG